MKFNKLYIYYRQCNFNKPNNTRPHFFNYEKCFKSLLDITQPYLGKNVFLKVVFDGNWRGTFTEKYKNAGYNFEIEQIDTGKFEGKSYEPNCGSSKSGSLTSQITSKDNLSNDSIILHAENDYLWCGNWVDVIFDIYNNLYQYSFRDSENHLLSLYSHPDTVLMINPNRTDDFSMYKNLESKIIATKFGYFRYLPTITSTWFMPKSLFDKGKDKMEYGTSDNQFCFEMNRDFGIYCLAPLFSYCCHMQLPWLSLYQNWEEINNKVQLL